MSKANSVGGQFLILIARICLALIFVIAGFNKIVNFDAVAVNMAAMGIPFSRLALIIAIILEFGGGLMLLLGWRARLGAWMLIVFTGLATFFYHPFWELDGGAAATQMQHFMKNLTIVGGMLYVAVHGGGTASIDGLRRRS